MEKCPKCGAEKMFRTIVSVIGDAKVEVAIYGDPDAIVFKQKTSSPLRSKTCGECGFVELYAASADLLFKVADEIEKGKTK